MPALDNLSRVADVSFTVARRAGSLAASAVRQVADMALERRSQSRARTSWTPPPPVPTPAAAAQPAAPEEAADDHVSREAVLVAESADAGAGDGAGAQIRVAEPWEGYDKLTAKEVNDRLATASPESLGVARLYEAANRNRVTVLREIDRRLAAGD
jgi:hypothetical protein